MSTCETAGRFARRLTHRPQFTVAPTRVGCIGEWHVVQASELCCPTDDTLRLRSVAFATKVEPTLFVFSLLGKRLRTMSTR
jgi:hypothetical protein